MEFETTGIDKDDYNYFRESVENINTRFTVLFRDGNAKILYQDDYIITEQSIIEKATAKKALLKFIREFRQYQFSK